MSREEDLVDVTRNNQVDDDDDDDDVKPKAEPGFVGRGVMWVNNHPWVQRVKQQRLHSCRPILTPWPMMFCFTFLALVFFLLGAILVAFSFTVVETKTYRYDNLCPLNSRCTVRFEVEDDMDKPVYLYYRMENFYQNHRRYVNSRSYGQLNDEHVNDYDQLEDCFPKISVDDEDNENAVFLPCGLVAWSTFNDTFVLRRDNKQKIDMDDDVAWDAEEDLYEDPGSGTKGVRIPAVPSFEDERFQVWMRTAALPNFLKLYGIIDEDLDEGVYRMEIENRYPVHDFEGKKFFKLSTTTWLGGRNFFLGWGFVVIGGLLFIVAVLTLIKVIVYPRKLGDPSYLNWR